MGGLGFAGTVAFLVGLTGLVADRPRVIRGSIDRDCVREGLGLAVESRCLLTVRARLLHLDNVRLCLSHR